MASSRFRSFHLYDAAGAPLSGVSPTVLFRLGRDGISNGPAPTIINAPGTNSYGFTCTVDQELKGTVFLIDGGASASPRYHVRVCATDGLVAFMLTGPTGALYLGTSAITWLSYVDAAGVSLIGSAPAITQLAGASQWYLQIAIIPPADLDRGVSAIAQSPASAYPAFHSVTLASEYAAPGPDAIAYSTSFGTSDAPVVFRDLAFDAKTKRFKRDARGGIALTSGIDAIRQDIELRLSLLLGEWFLNATLGFPLFERVLVKSPNLSAIRDLFSAKIAEVPGVLAVLSLTLNRIAATRKLSVSFTVSTDLGELSSTFTR